VQTNESVFLHSSWRAGSTYVWEKFRRRSDTYCYFEPLNEHLFTLTPEIIDRFVPWSFSNHPALSVPYLEEFRPLTRAGGGIQNFPAHLTFGRYCATGDDSLPELEIYMADLASLARRLNRRPVYGFVRTDLRVGWFRARMPGVHIFIRRDPRRQFLSMLCQAVQGNPYFLQRGVVILRHNLEEAAFAPLLAAPELKPLPAVLDSSGLRAAFRGKLVDEKILRQVYFIFYFMWLLARRLGEPQCHLVIDIDRLSLDDVYRREIENRLGDLVGMAISFTDCNVGRYEENLKWSGPLFEALEQEIEALARGRAHEPGPRAALRGMCKMECGAHSSTVRAADS
jgi:hypothetical protein